MSVSTNCVGTNPYSARMTRWICCKIFFHALLMSSALRKVVGEGMSITYHTLVDRESMATLNQINSLIIVLAQVSSKDRGA